MTGAAALAALLAGPAHAAGEAGIGIDIFKDLPDSFDEAEDVHFGPGPALRGLVRVPVGERTVVRGTLSVGVAVGQDRVEWDEYDGAVRYYSDDHWTMLSSSRLVLGPELIFLDRSGMKAFWGAQAGVGWVQNWHSFQLAGSGLMDPGLNDLESGSNIDPYSSQLVPTSGVHIGLGLADLAPFAIEVEAGHYVAFLSRADLRKTSEEAEAVRTAFGLNALSVGVTAILPFGGEAD